MNDNWSQPLETASCPVCRARFRGVSLCPRCGADLERLMLLKAHAYLLRQSARRFLRAGDARSALVAAQSAQQLHATVHGKLLETVCAIVENCNAPANREGAWSSSKRRPAQPSFLPNWRGLSLSAAVILGIAAGSAYWRRRD